MLLDHPAKIDLMGEETTRGLHHSPPFEDSVFARFDRVDARFDGIDRRLDGIDSRVQTLEARALDTKPIWERTLTEILQIRNGVENLNRKMDVVTLDMNATAR